MAVNRDDYLTILETAANRVPYWARSTNPIVRRHMGFNWRTVPPETQPIAIGLMFWGAVFLIGIFLPFVQSMMMMVLLAAWVLMPFVWIGYAYILIQVAIRAADIMQAEQRNNTLELLMTTPMSLGQILLGKVAAAIWQRMDDLYIIAMLVVWLAPPMLFATYEPIWGMAEYPGISQLVIMLSLVVSLARILLEPIMIGALAVFIGAVTTARSIAITTTLAVAIAVFTLLIIVRRLPMLTLDPVAVILMDFVLAVALPLGLTALFLWGAARFITED